MASGLLPQEILEEILGHLQKDVPTLLSCSLSSFAFLRASRPHLFQELRVTLSKSQVFMDLLDAPWCSFSGLARRMAFMHDNDNTCSPHAATCKVTPKLQYDTRCLQKRLRKVKSISFSGISFRDIPTQFWSLLRSLPAVKHLELHGTDLGSPTMFNKYISSCALLESLTISGAIAPFQTNNGDAEDVEWPIFPQDRCSLLVPLLDIGRPPHMGISMENQRLSSSGIASVAILDLISSLDKPPKVRMLKVDFNIEKALVKPLSKFLHNCGHHVEELSLNLPSAILGASFILISKGFKYFDIDTVGLRNMPILDVSAMTGIKILRIEGLLLSHQHIARTMNEIFQGVFDQLFSPYSNYASTAGLQPVVQTVSISLDVDAQHSADSYAFSFFTTADSLLQHYSWCSLPSILSKSLSSFPKALEKLRVDLNIKARTIAVEGRARIERNIREVFWKDFAQRGNLNVLFE